MSTSSPLPFETALEVRNRCICLHLQRAARRVARIFDEALRPLELTNGQFSLLMSLNRPDPAAISTIATSLAMDRTTVTANLKPLERRGLVKVTVDKDDKRGRRLTLTAAGRNLLIEALPIWKSTHTAVDALLARPNPDALRADLRALA